MSIVFNARQAVKQLIWTRVRLRGYSIYGIRFKARGKIRRVLPGLKPRDAEKLLLQLKTFGADVPDPPVVSSELKDDDIE